MKDLRFFEDADVDTLVALVVELASQLHEERTQRIALEARLVACGVLDDDDTIDEAALERSREELGHAVGRLMRIIEEAGPPQHPILLEAHEDSWAARHG